MKMHLYLLMSLALLLGFCQKIVAIHMRAPDFENWIRLMSCSITY